MKLRKKEREELGIGKEGGTLGERERTKHVPTSFFTETLAKLSMEGKKTGSLTYLYAYYTHTYIHTHAYCIYVHYYYTPRMVREDLRSDGKNERYLTPKDEWEKRHSTVLFLTFYWMVAHALWPEKNCAETENRSQEIENRTAPTPFQCFFFPPVVAMPNREKIEMHDDRDNFSEATTKHKRKVKRVTRKFYFFWKRIWGRRTKMKYFLDESNQTKSIYIEGCALPTETTSAPAWYFFFCFALATLGMVIIYFFFFSFIFFFVLIFALAPRARSIFSSSICVVDWQRKLIKRATWEEKKNERGERLICERQTRTRCDKRASPAILR